MAIQIKIDVEGAKEYMANADNLLVGDLPLWVALSLCTETYKKLHDDKPESTDITRTDRYTRYCPNCGKEMK